MHSDIFDRLMINPTDAVIRLKSASRLKPPDLAGFRKQQEIFIILRCAENLRGFMRTKPFMFFFVMRRHALLRAILRIFLPAARLLFAFCFLPFAVIAQTAQEIVEKSDDARNLGQPFKMRMRLTNLVDEKQKDQAEFELLVSGRDKTLVKFASGRDRGNYLLMAGDDMWIYILNTRKPIRITPIQRLMGEASNGDVARANFSQDYDATLLSEEALDGSTCWKLELKAKSPGATYHRIEY
jgi:hypothetical protein